MKLQYLYEKFYKHKVFLWVFVAGKSNFWIRKKIEL